MKQQLNVQPTICCIYKVNPVLHPDIVTPIYNNVMYQNKKLQISHPQQHLSLKNNNIIYHIHKFAACKNMNHFCHHEYE